MRKSYRIIVVTALASALAAILIWVISASNTSDDAKIEAAVSAWHLCVPGTQTEKRLPIHNAGNMFISNQTDKSNDAIDRIIGMKHQGESFLLMVELFSTALSRDAKGTISQLAKRNFDPALYELLAPLLKDYGKQNPSEAIDLMNQLESFEETRWLGPAYEGVLIKNPELARSALHSSGEFGLYHNLDSYLKSISLSSTSPELLNQIVDVFNSAEDKSVDIEPAISNALQNQIERKASSGLNELTDFATAFSATSLKDISLAAENLGSAIARISPEAALAWSGTLSEEVRPGVLQEIVNKWAARDLDAAVEFGFSSQGTLSDQTSMITGLYDATKGNESYSDVEKKCAEWLTTNNDWFARTQ